MDLVLEGRNYANYHCFGNLFARCMAYPMDVA